MDQSDFFWFDIREFVFCFGDVGDRSLDRWDAQIDSPIWNWSFFPSEKCKLARKLIFKKIQQRANRLSTLKSSLLKRELFMIIAAWASEKLLKSTRARPACSNLPKTNTGLKSSKYWKRIQYPFTKPNKFILKNWITWRVIVRINSKCRYKRKIWEQRANYLH